jgi:hypothetical protein
MTRQALHKSPRPRDEVNPGPRVHVPEELRYRNLLSGDERPQVSTFCTGETASLLHGHSTLFLAQGSLLTIGVNGPLNP